MFRTNIARISKALRAYAASVSLRQAAFIVVGTAISSFGVYNIHQQSGITEGGVIGLILLANRWLGLSPSIATPVLDAACYLFAFRFLGGRFLCLSVASTASLTVLFRIWEQFPPLLPNLSGSPLIAALLGGLFVGTGVGFVIRGGGSCGGDDALALTIAHLTKWRIARAYLLTDITVLVDRHHGARALALVHSREPHRLLARHGHGLVVPDRLHTEPRRLPRGRGGVTRTVKEI